MKHGRMVLAAEIPAYRGEGMPGHFFAEVHPHMARLHDFPLAFPAQHQVFGDAEICTGGAADIFHRRRCMRVVGQFAQRLPDERHIYFAPVQCGVREELYEGAFQLAYILLDMLRHEFDEFIRDGDALVVGLAVQNGDSGFQLGLLQVGHEPALKPRKQPVRHAGNVLRRAVCRENNLFSGLMQQVERVEQALLRDRLVAEELDVVNDQQVYVAVEGDEVVVPVCPQRLHVVRREVVARRIQDLVVAVLPDMVADGLHEVRFAQADPAIDQKRVEGRMARLLGDGQRGAARELVAIAFYESIEGVRGVQRKSGCNKNRTRGLERV